MTLTPFRVTVTVTAFSAIFAASLATTSPAQAFPRHVGWVGDANLINRSADAAWKHTEAKALPSRIAACYGEGYEALPAAATKWVTSTATFNSPPQQVVDAATMSEADYAEAWGYGVFSEAYDLGDGSAADITTKQLETAQLNTLRATGVLEAGPHEKLLECYHKESRTEAELSGILEYAQLEGAYLSALHDLSEDSRYEAQHSDWAECMTAKGHNDTTPLGAFLRFHELVSTPMSDEALFGTIGLDEEKATARDAVACGGSVRVFLSDHNQDLWNQIAAQHKLSD